MQKAGSRIEKAQNKSLWSQTIHNSSLWNTKRLQNEDLTLEIMSSDSLDPRRPCHRLRVNLKICLLQTDCCRIEKVSCFYLELNLHKLQDSVISYLFYWPAFMCWNERLGSHFVAYFPPKTYRLVLSLIAWFIFLT